MACFVLHPEVGHEGEAADLAAEAAEPLDRGVVGIVKEVVSGRVAADRDGIGLADPHAALVACPTVVELAAEGVGGGALDLQ